MLDEVLGETRYKQPINQKKKGNLNEREVCKFLQLWTGQKFIRTPASGGRRLENNDMFVGDVVCENQDFKFVFTVETKHYQKLGLKTLKGQMRANAKIFGFWEQAKSDAERAKKIPMLLVRENDMPKGTWLVFMQRTDLFWNTCLRLGIDSVAEGFKYGIIGIKSSDLLKIPYETFA